MTAGCFLPNVVTEHHQSGKQKPGKPGYLNGPGSIGMRFQAFLVFAPGEAGIGAPVVNEGLNGLSKQVLCNRSGDGTL